MRLKIGIIWILLIVANCIVGVIAYNAEVNPTFRFEIMLKHSLILLVLSMPTGYVLMFLLGAVLDWFAFIPKEAISQLVWMSIICGIGGYLQWFVLLPWVWRKYKSSKN